MFKLNHYSMKEISLTKGKVAIVDDDDFDNLNQYKWRALQDGVNFYAVRNMKRPRIYKGLIRMHRVILGLTDPAVLVDHKDMDGLNNQRNNLRIANKSQNGANRNSELNSVSKFKGVCWDSSNKKWKVQIRKDGKRSSLGMFHSEQDAADAYNKAAIKLHGEFAKLNIL